VEAFIAAELERTAPSSAATRYRSLQRLFKWLDDQVWGLLAACSGKDSHAADL
jgi:hypothetical protein